MIVRGNTLIIFVRKILIKHDVVVDFEIYRSRFQQIEPNISEKFDRKIMKTHKESFFNVSTVQKWVFRIKFASSELYDWGKKIVVISSLF